LKRKPVRQEPDFYHHEMPKDLRLAITDAWAKIQAHNNLPDIMQEFFKQWNIIGWAGVYGDVFKPKVLQDTIPNLISLSYRMWYSPRCSNTHSSPKGFPQNFGQQAGIPKHYPGFIGDIRAVLDCDPKRAGFRDAVNNTAFNTGSGGGGFNGKVAKYSYGITLFLADFPNMEQRIVDECVMGRLSQGGDNFNFVEQYDNTLTAE